jgi:hypothetical protein
MSASHVHRGRVVVVVVSAAVLAGCDDSAPRIEPTQTTAATAVVSSTVASPTPPATPASPLPTSGVPRPDCVNGWTSPRPGDADFTDPIGIIRRTAPFDGPFEVVDIRMFTGPESPPSDQGYLADVRRWYVKLFAVEDISYQGRFLVEQRAFGRGVSAVASYDSNGFSSPDWIGFQGEPGAPPAAYVGLPGRWRGVAYDFVNGGAGLTIPGLPDEVRGCLDGT